MQAARFGRLVAGAAPFDRAPAHADFFVNFVIH
jgi:hypothetical protein